MCAVRTRGWRTGDSRSSVGRIGRALSLVVLLASRLHVTGWNRFRSLQSGSGSWITGPIALARMVGWMFAVAGSGEPRVDRVPREKGGVYRHLGGLSRSSLFGVPQCGPARHESPPERAYRFRSPRTGTCSQPFFRSRCSSRSSPVFFAIWTRWGDHAFILLAPFSPCTSRRALRSRGWMGVAALAVVIAAAWAIRREIRRERGSQRAFSRSFSPQYPLVDLVAHAAPGGTVAHRPWNPPHRCGFQLAGHEFPRCSRPAASHRQVSPAGTANAASTARANFRRFAIISRGAAVAARARAWIASARLSHGWGPSPPTSSWESGSRKPGRSTRRIARRSLEAETAAAPRPFAARTPVPKRQHERLTKMPRGRSRGISSVRREFAAAGVADVPHGVKRPAVRRRFRTRT